MLIPPISKASFLHADPACNQGAILHSSLLAVAVRLLQPLRCAGPSLQRQGLPFLAGAAQVFQWHGIEAPLRAKAAAFLAAQSVRAIERGGSCSCTFLTPEEVEQLISVGGDDNSFAAHFCGRGSSSILLPLVLIRTRRGAAACGVECWLTRSLLESHYPT